jgi:hypothetical protein
MWQKTKEEAVGENILQMSTGVTIGAQHRAIAQHSSVGYFTIEERQGAEGEGDLRGRERGHYETWGSVGNVLLQVLQREREGGGT